MVCLTRRRIMQRTATGGRRKRKTMNPCLVKICLQMRRAMGQDLATPTQAASVVLNKITAVALHSVLVFKSGL